MNNHLVPRRGEIIDSPVGQPVSRPTARHLSAVHDADWFVKPRFK